MIALLLLLSAVPGLTFGETAHADILFVDLNFSYKEIAAAREAAAARGEKLVIVPDLSDADRALLYKQAEQINGRKAKLQSIQKQLDTATLALARAPGQGANVIALKTQLDSMKAAIAPAAAAYDQLRHQKLGPDLDKGLTEAISGALAKADKDKTHFSSVVISGHNDGGQYFGEAGGVKDAWAFANFAAHPSSKAIDSFYGWGCYTNTVDALSMVLESLPKIKVVAGFNGRSPSQERPIDEAYLKSVMTREKEASIIASTEDCKNFLKVIPGINDVTSQLYVNNGVCGSYYGNQRGAISFEDRNQDCTPAAVNQALSAAEGYKKYRDALPGFENPPANTDSGEVRKFYELLRHYAHCASFKSLARTGLDPNIVLPLVLFKSVRENFATYYASALPAFKAAWGNGAPPVPDFGTASRKQILDFETALKAKLADANAVKALQPADAVTIGVMSKRIDALLVGFYCTPEKWVEAPTGAPAAPNKSCVP